MFIIPCKFDKNNPIIFSCIDAIKRYHPDDEICVIDSNSSDTGYKNDLDKNVIFYDVKNNFYVLEAYNIAYQDNRDKKFFYCIHDSLILQSNISFVENSNLTTIRWWNSPPVQFGSNEDGSDLSIWANEQLVTYLGYPIPSVYKGVFGPMFLCSYKVLEALERSGIFNIKPKNKYELCAMERIIGIVLTELGYDVTNSLQGEGGELFDIYDETYVKKIHLERM
jgi:hypothetical protein